MDVSVHEGKKAATLSRPNAQVKQLTSVTVGFCFCFFCGLFFQIATSIVKDKSISISTVCQLCRWAKLVCYENETNL